MISDGSGRVRRRRETFGIKVSSKLSMAYRACSRFGWGLFEYITLASPIDVYMYVEILSLYTA